MRRILSLCDYTGNWSQPYVAAGYDVVRVDLQHGGDVRLMEKGDAPVHGILAAPPCTCFASSGARWKRSESDMVEALSVVDACIRLAWAHRDTLRWWALENPIGKLVRYLGKPLMRFDPCDFGDPYTKRTCLWGSFTPPMPLMIGKDLRVPPTEGSKMHTRYGGKSQATKKRTQRNAYGVCARIFRGKQMKTPDGFRAVRYCDSQRIYYVTEQTEDGWFKAVSDDGKVKLLVEPKAFKITFCREHNPDMPPVVCARFEGKPTFTEWWAANVQKDNAA